MDRLAGGKIGAGFALDEVIGFMTLLVADWQG
jgi:hypothetical protein